MKHRIKIRKCDFSSQRIEKHKDYAQLLERHQRASGLKANNFLVGFVVLACVLGVSYYALDRIEKLATNAEPVEEVVGENSLPNVEQIPKAVVEKSPRPKVGLAAYNRYMLEKITSEVNLEGLGEFEEGVIYVSFNVEVDGSLTDIRVVKGLCAICDELALNLIKDGPEWLPGERNGEVIKAPMVVPITFAIEKLPTSELDSVVR